MCFGGGAGLCLLGEQDVTHKCRSALSRIRPAFPRAARGELALFHQKLPPLSTRGSFAKVVSKGLFCKGSLGKVFIKGSLCKVVSKGLFSKNCKGLVCKSLLARGSVAKFYKQGLLCKKSLKLLSSTDSFKCKSTTGNRDLDLSKICSFSSSNLSNMHR